MDEQRLRQEGAFIVDSRPAPPRLVCGYCGGREMVGTTAKVSGHTVAVKVVCSDCGTAYFVVGTTLDREAEHGG